MVGQLDKKFIVTLLTESKKNRKGQVICVFDQHAVDERVTLERLLASKYPRKYHVYSVLNFALNLGEKNCFKRLKITVWTLADCLIR